MATLKNGEWIDAGDIVNFLVIFAGMDSEMAFYFYEHCENSNIINDCETYEDVERIMAEAFTNRDKLHWFFNKDSQKKALTVELKDYDCEKEVKAFYDLFLKDSFTIGKTYIRTIETQESFELNNKL